MLTYGKHQDRFGAAVCLFCLRDPLSNVQDVRFLCGFSSFFLCPMLFYDYVSEKKYLPCYYFGSEMDYELDLGFTSRQSILLRY